MLKYGSQQKFNFSILGKAKTRRKMKLFLLVLPLLCLVFLFHYIPLLGWAYAFVDYVPGVPLKEMNFVGLKYFEYLFSDISEFPTVIRNTLALSLLKIATMIVPVIFAIMLSQMQSKRYSKIIQTASSIPNFISWVLIYAIFFIFFSSESGLMNKMLEVLGFGESVNLLGNENIAWGVQTAITIWKQTGWDAIIYIAAIAGIDPALYDAAAVDGAGRFKKILHVTIPGITPTFFVLFLMAVANILSNGFEQYYVFQNPMVVDRLEVFDTYIYRMGIVNSQYSYATAMGMFKSIISIVLLTVANGTSKKIRGESIF
ncbi:sn-glycerol-3-phosphate transport system permease protein ugpA [uncultured Ruminococcus sp.]|uniref:Sugar ABC transporter permease n=1 Tax=Massiliimalia timonensis TaxID=1987501 RepID=A0A8J6PBT8_9FIRM|nr:ABC transporter permease subunit [Massiliimalia timonensis]MBC8611287.1 sugar ABC transporter permease [Massiliimalia timonensis]MBS7176229.1 sugar ABC transporter permease [Clostridiales bacterium]SCH06532.1 sn-glycerol-3-phosphate transport system permease protein ugpA [uncultured Clostridium sp.]SCI02643.1 sn-glycerol-3-phosphate transport system permease protein ugpA [uncultured Ruminococcus sp.]